MRLYALLSPMVNVGFCVLTAADVGCKSLQLSFQGLCRATWVHTVQAALGARLGRGWWSSPAFSLQHLGYVGWGQVHACIAWHEPRSHMQLYRIPVHLPNSVPRGHSFPRSSGCKARALVSQASGPHGGRGEGKNLRIPLHSQGQVPVQPPLTWPQL